MLRILDAWLSWHLWRITPRGGGDYEIWWWMWEAHYRQRLDAACETYRARWRQRLSHWR